MSFSAPIRSPWLRMMIAVIEQAATGRIAALNPNPETQTCDARLRPKSEVLVPSPRAPGSVQ